MPAMRIDTDTSPHIILSSHRAHLARKLLATWQAPVRPRQTPAALRGPTRQLVRKQRGHVLRCVLSVHMFSL